MQQDVAKTLRNSISCVQYLEFITAILRIKLVEVIGEQQILTHSQSGEVVVEVADLAPSNKKSAIHVLHVDDDPSLQEITKLMLLDLDSSFEIDHACCVDEGFSKLAVGRYDVVVSDYEMPQKDGLQFLKELREQKIDIPFIIFTGKGREEVSIKALNLGVDGYFNKQGSPETVYGELCYGIIQTVDHKRAEEALKKSEEQYRAYTENSPIAFFVVNPEGKYTQVNDAATKLLLYSKNELLKMSIMDILFEKDISLGLKQFATLKETGKSRFETALKRKDGEPVYVILNATRLSDGNMMAFCENITEPKRLNDELKLSEERLKLLFDKAPDAYYLNDLKGNFLDGNKAAEEMIGYSRNELIGSSFLSLNVLSRNQILKAAKLLALNAIGKPTGPDELILNRKNGTQISVEIRTHPLKIQGKKLILGIARDISERKAAEEKLRETQEKYETTFESSMDALMLLDEKGFFECNKTTLLVFGCKSVNEFTKFHPADLSPPTQPDGSSSMTVAISHIQKALQTGTDHFFWIHKRMDGTTFPADVLLTRIQLKGREVLQATVRDITEQKKAEQALVEAKDRNQSYLDIADVMIVVISPDQNTILANKKTLEVLGYSEDEILGRNWFDVVIPEADRPIVKKSFSNIIFGKIELFKYVENHVLTKNGELRLIAWHNSVLKDKEGNIVASLSSGQDITEQKKTESELKMERNALRQSEAKMRSIVENSSDQIFMLDENLKYLSVNKTLGDVLGKTPQEIIGKSINEVYGQETASKFSNNIKNVFETCKSVFVEEKMVAQGHELYISTSLNPVQDDTGNVIAVAGIVRDITESKKAEEAIKFQADLLNHVGQAVIMVDNNRIIRFWNKAAEKLYGYSEEQALGHNVTALLGVDSPEKADEVSRRLMAGESWSTETSAKNKDGSNVPVILNRTPIFKEDGEFSGAASITTDISLQKSTEADLTFSLESLSNSLVKIQELNEKLRVVGGLTRHDVRNKLTTVTGYAYLLKKKHTNEADVVEGLSKMELAVRESMKIFDFAKLYEQLGAEELTYVDVEAKLNEAAVLFSGSLPKIINDCHGLTVLADSFLRQMFYNFIDNTRKYGQKTTAIKMHYQKTDRGNLELIYEDDGVGISAENKLKLFSEGFSTGGSTGFGLFLTKKMIEVYGWEIIENGLPGEGVKFTITIPKLNKSGKENYQIDI